MRSAMAGCLFLCVVASPAAAQDEKPINVTVCELQNDPDAFNHKLVRVRGRISHEFESFTIYDPECPDGRYPTWLIYGGDGPEDVIYCCGSAGTKDRLEIEGIEVPLKRDAVFERFRRLLNSYRVDKKTRVAYLQDRPSYVVTATLVGRFFAGEAGQALGRGFGHMGCCTLLAIEQVVSIDAVVSNVRPGELDCALETWLNGNEGETLSAGKESAAKSDEEWRTRDYRRVAAEALSRHRHGSEADEEFRGCEKDHESFPGTEDVQVICTWVSGANDSHTVQLLKLALLEDPTTSGKNVPWTAYQVTHQHCSENAEPE